MAFKMDALQIDPQLFPESRAWTYGATLLAALFLYYTLRTKPTQFPFLDTGATRWSRQTAKNNYVKNAQKLLAQGARMVRNRLSSPSEAHSLTAITLVLGSIQPHH